MGQPATSLWLVRPDMTDPLRSKLHKRTAGFLYKRMEIPRGLSWATHGAAAARSWI